MLQKVLIGNLVHKQGSLFFWTKNMNRLFKLIDKVENGRIDPIIHTGTFLVPGLVAYHDVKAGICKLTKETIDGMLNSIKGIPVVIGHPAKDTSKLTQEELKELQNGVVIDAFFNEKIGEFQCHFITTTSEAEDLVKKGHSLSVAYNNIKLGPGGVYHAIKFDQEILNGQFTHLAIVESKTARYEEAYIDTGIEIFLNSVGGGHILIEKPKQEDKAMKFKFQFPFIAKNSQEVDTTKASVTIGDKQVTVKQLVEAYNAKKSAGENIIEVDEDREFEITNSKGEKETVTVKQLMDAFNAEESDEDKAKKAKDEKDEKEFENSLSDDEKCTYAKMDKEAKNAFKMAKNAKKSEMKNVDLNAKVEVKNDKGELVKIGIQDLISSFNAHTEAGRNLETFQLINSKRSSGEIPAVVAGTSHDGTLAAGLKAGEKYFQSGKFAKK